MLIPSPEESKIDLLSENSLDPMAHFYTLESRLSTQPCSPHTFLLLHQSDRFIDTTLLIGRDGLSLPRPDAVDGGGATPEGRAKRNH